MADTKISDMAAATEVLNAEVVPIVQGGVNKKCAASVFFVSAAGEDRWLIPSTGQHVGMKNAAADGKVQVDDAGNLDVFTTENLTLGREDLSSYIRLTDADAWEWPCGGAIVGLTIGNLGSLSIFFDFTTDRLILEAIGGVTLPYTPAVTGDWTGADPVDVAEALDRIAAALGPIA